MNAALVEGPEIRGRSIGAAVATHGVSRVERALEDPTDGRTPTFIDGERLH